MWYVSIQYSTRKRGNEDSSTVGGLAGDKTGHSTDLPQPHTHRDRKWEGGKRVWMGMELVLNRDGASLGGEDGWWGRAAWLPEYWGDKA